VELSQVELLSKFVTDMANFVESVLEILHSTDALYIYDRTPVGTLPNGFQVVWDEFTKDQTTDSLRIIASAVGVKTKEMKTRKALELGLKPVFSYESQKRDIILMECDYYKN
jgi:hypothetical protein